MIKYNLAVICRICTPVAETPFPNVDLISLLWAPGQLLKHYYRAVTLTCSGMTEWMVNKKSQWRMIGKPQTQYLYLI